LEQPEGKNRTDPINQRMKKRGGEKGARGEKAKYRKGEREEEEY